MTLRLRRPSLVALAVIAAVLALDQVTKGFVVAAADRLPATVFGGIRLEIVRNTGVSFSLFTGRGWMVTLLVGLVMLVLLVLFLTLPRRYSMPLALLLGGSLGNLIDRFRYGYVVDYVAIYWWPRFNVADVAIIAGAILMVLAVMLHPAVRATPVDGGGQDSSPTAGGRSADSADDTPTDHGSRGSAAPAASPGRASETAATSADRSAPPSNETDRLAVRGGPAEP